MYLIDYYYGPQGGTEGQLLELVGGLNRQRFEPFLTVLRPSQYTQSGGAFPCPVEVVPVPSVGDPRGWLRLARFARQLRRRRVRLVHIFFNDAAALAPAFCRMAGTRIITSRRDMGFWYTPPLLRLLQFSNRFVDAIVTNAEAVRANVLAKERPPIEKIHVVYNGHDPRRFDREPLANFRASLGIPEDAILIGMVANLWPRKRQVDLIHSLARVRRRHPTARVLLAGDGTAQMIASLREEASRAGVEGFVHFLGTVSDPVPVIHNFDVSVLCSDNEGCSNTILEYMGCGRPTVCTQVGGNPELIEDGVNGLLVPACNPPALAAAIDRLLSNPATARQLGAAARQTMLDRFTTTAMIARHMALYDQLLARN